MSDNPEKRLKDIEDILKVSKAMGDTSEELEWLISRIHELEAALMVIATEKKASFKHSRKSRLLAQRVLCGTANAPTEGDKT